MELSASLQWLVSDPITATCVHVRACALGLHLSGHVSGAGARVRAVARVYFWTPPL